MILLSLTSNTLWNALDGMKVHANKKKIIPTTTSAPSVTGQPEVPPQPQISTR